MALTLDDFSAFATGAVRDPAGRALSFDQLKAFANRAQEAICEAAYMLEAKATLTATADDNFTLPSDFIAVVEADREDAGVIWDDVRLFPTSDLAENVVSPSSSGDPQHYNTFAERLRVYPKIATANKVITVFHYRYAANLTSKTQESEVPRHFNDAMIAYVIWRATQVMIGAHTDAAGFALRQYEDTLEKAMMRWHGARPRVRGQVQGMFSAPDAYGPSATRPGMWPRQERR